MALLLAEYVLPVAEGGPFSSPDSWSVVSPLDRGQSHSLGSIKPSARCLNGAKEQEKNHHIEDSCVMSLGQATTSLGDHLKETSAKQRTCPAP